MPATRSAARPSRNWHCSSTTLAPAFAIQRLDPRDTAATMLDQLRAGVLGDAHRAVARDVHVMREPVVAARRPHPLRRRLAVERDVDHRRVEDRRLDRNRRRDVHDDVAVAHACRPDAAGSRPSCRSPGRRRPARSSGTASRRSRPACPRIPRTRPASSRGCSRTRICAGSGHAPPRIARIMHAQHVIVMRIQLARRRRQRDQLARRIGADRAGRTPRAARSCRRENSRSHCGVPATRISSAGSRAARPPAASSARSRRSAGRRGGPAAACW